MHIEIHTYTPIDVHEHIMCYYILDTSIRSLTYPVRTSTLIPTLSNHTLDGASWSRFRFRKFLKYQIRSSKPRTNQGDEHGNDDAQFVFNICDPFDFDPFVIQICDP